MAHDWTLDLLINKEQYDFINQERAALDLFHATGNLKNLDPAYLKYLANTSALIYNIKRPNVNCPQCVAQMLRPLIHQLHKYEESGRK
jgi:hypothetical protein